MKIKILKTSYQQETQLYEVEFSSSIGDGKGTWSTGGIPLISRYYHVELDSGEEQLIWGSNICRTESTDTLIRHDGSATFIQGKIVATSDEGDISIRLDDSVEIFRAHGQSVPPESFVEIKIQQLKIYDMNL